jgi:hypothetical protein
MKTIDLSGHESVILRIGPTVYVVDARAKMDIADYLDNTGCPQVNSAQYALATRLEEVENTHGIGGETGV